MSCSQLQWRVVMISGLNSLERCHISQHFPIRSQFKCIKQANVSRKGMNSLEHLGAHVDVPNTNDWSTVRISCSVESMLEASPWALEMLIAPVYFVVFSNIPSITQLMTGL